MKQFLSTNKYFIIALLLIPLIALPSLSGKQGPLIELYDYGEHAASIREMSNNLFSPENPLLATDGSTTLRYTPYIFLLGLFKKWSHLGLFTVIGFASIGSFLLLLVGLYLWGKEYFHNEKLPLYILIAFLFLWGKPFNYSNEYNLRFLAYSLFYPSILTFNLSFLGFYLILKYARSEKLRYYFLYLLCSVFIFLTHPLTASFFLLGSGLLALTEGKRKIQNVLLFGLSVLIIFICALFWPYHSFIEAVIKSTTTDWYYPFRMHLYDTRNIYRMGPALLGLPVIALFLIRRQYAFISWGFLLCTLIYLLSYVLNIRLGERYIFFIMVFLHLALAWYFSRLELLSFSTISKTLTSLSERNLHVVFFLIIITLSIFYQCAKLGFEQAGYLITFKPRPLVHTYRNPLDNYRSLQAKLKEGDIVLTDPLTAWLLPALTGAKITALYHNNPLVPDNNQRVHDTLTFYNSSTSLEMRKVILKKYGGTHVLLNLHRMQENEINRLNDYYQNFKIDQRLMNDVQKMGKIIFRNDQLILFELHFRQ